MKKNVRNLHGFEIVLLFLAFMFLAVSVSVVFSGEAEAKDVVINVKWDADVVSLDSETGLPISLAWEKLNFYTRLEGGPGYDYSAPIFTLPQTYVDDLSTPTETPLTIDLPDGVSSTVYVVVRSAANNMESADSDEASAVIDLTALAAFEFSAAYNEVADSVDLSWPVGDARVKEWAVFVSAAPGGPYEELTRVQAGSGDASISVPAASMFPAGTITVKYFTMVAFGSYGVFSPNATEVSIVRNRTTPADVINLQIFLTE